VKFFVPKFSPEVRFDETFLRRAFNAPCVVACIHSQTEFAICAALDRAGLQTAFVSAEPVSRPQLENYNFSILPLNILRQPDLFVKARAALKSGRVVVCDADFILNKGLPNAQVCISKSLFEFRRMSGANLFFGHVQISEDGAMDCIIEAVPQRSASALDDAKHFIDFLARFEGTPPQLTIRDWPAPAQD
jgi:hypothetical protein